MAVNPRRTAGPGPGDAHRLPEPDGRGPGDPVSGPRGAAPPQHTWARSGRGEADGEAESPATLPLPTGGGEQGSLEGFHARGAGGVSGPIGRCEMRVWVTVRLSVPALPRCPHGGFSAGCAPRAPARLEPPANGLQGPWGWAGGGPASSPGLPALPHSLGVARDPAGAGSPFPTQVSNVARSTPKRVPLSTRQPPSPLVHPDFPFAPQPP